MPRKKNKPSPPPPSVSFRCVVNPETLRVPTLEEMAAQARARGPLLRAKLVKDKDTRLHYWLHWYKEPFTRKNAEYAGIQWMPWNRFGLASLAALGLKYTDDKE
jgi:hypothetical protein